MHYAWGHRSESVACPLPPSALDVPGGWTLQPAVTLGLSQISGTHRAPKHQETRAPVPSSTAATPHPVADSRSQRWVGVSCLHPPRDGKGSQRDRRSLVTSQHSQQQQPLHPTPVSSTLPAAWPTCLWPHGPARSPAASPCGPPTATAHQPHPGATPTLNSCLAHPTPIPRL